MRGEEKISKKTLIFAFGVISIIIIDMRTFSSLFSQLLNQHNQHGFFWWYQAFGTPIT